MTQHTDTADSYYANPLIHSDRRLGTADSEWVRSFSCEDVRPLIVCRGPIRKETIDVCREMGITDAGILLSEKDSIVYTKALAPELRFVPPQHVHRVCDYSGATREERLERIDQIIQICRDHGYDHVFAGYGFMAEDETFVSALERAGLTFIGPCSHTVRSAGAKDEAKKTALREEVSVTPGVNNLTARTLLKKHSDLAALKRLAAAEKLAVDEAAWAEDLTLAEAAEHLLAAAYARGVDLFTIDELAEAAAEAVSALLVELPGRRFRLKAIGGGGGKGQRIVSAANQAPEALREILSEVKTTGVGDNKNVIIELNIEQTRHIEIQLVGNGEWAVALGGRDCSLQMHEQKLVEISLTQETLAAGIDKAKAAGRHLEQQALERELAMLQAMEAEAERFGRAVRLDSASTFEGIVDQGRHYFMEVNTRIQVEHRVSELCYALRFTNPEDEGDFFDVHSLVEAMVLLARHGARLPRPSRVPRSGAAVEARLNATNRALRPHAGGLVQSWSDPQADEVRDDQGICWKNPDTNRFVQYKLAGAYDSNIALTVTVGEDRAASFDRLIEILRQMKIRGDDLETNLAFHYGLAHWLRARNVNAMPSTGFVVPYLTQIGLLKKEALKLDIVYAWSTLRARAEQAFAADAKALQAMRTALSLKDTLLKRPIDALFAEPHVLSAWLSAHRGDWRLDRGGKVEWLRNPLEVLEDTYFMLNMEWDPARPPAEVIWDHDHALIKRGLAFYRHLAERVGALPWPKLSALLARDKAPAGIDRKTWAKIRGAHAGFQAGLEMLGLLPVIGDNAGFWGLDVKPDLSVSIPDRLLDPALQKQMGHVLVPPPATSEDEIVAVSGGMYYGQEAPGRPPLIREGDHFEAGQPLYIIEVMKMFNKVPAPFAGTVDAILIEDDGTIVKKGQPLFKVTADVKLVPEDPREVNRRRRSATDDVLRRIL